jgi:hypothetical protein
VCRGAALLQRPRLTASQEGVTARQKSAEGIVIWKLGRSLKALLDRLVCRRKVEVTV